MKQSDIESNTNFSSLMSKFIDDKRHFHDILDVVENNEFLKKINEDAKAKVPDTVYRGVYFWEEDFDDDDGRVSIPREIMDKEKHKTNLRGKAFSSCSTSKEVAEKFSRVLGDFGYVIEFKIQPSDILLVPLAFSRFLDSDETLSTLKYEKEVIIDPTKTRISRVQKVRRT